MCMTFVRGYVRFAALVSENVHIVWYCAGAFLMASR